MYGPYIFDNSAPSVEFNPDGKEEWATSHTTTVTIKENEYGQKTTEGTVNILTADKITAADYGGYVTNSYQKMVQL